VIFTELNQPIDRLVPFYFVLPARSNKWVERMPVLLFECENVLLDAVMQKEGAGYSESGHEFNDISRLMAWAWTYGPRWYLVDHLFAVENLKDRG